MISIVYIWNTHVQNEKASKLSTEQLKDLWDRWDGITPVDGIWGETVHLELNKRGEGYYCAL